MSSRRSVRQLIVAVLLGVLVGGGLMAITPAGAEVSQSLATSWKKIWKKELKPLADKRYYKKSQSDGKYASKAEAAAAAAAAQAAATSAANSATDGKLGGYYKKTESDAKYAPAPGVVRGSWALMDTAAAAGNFLTADLNWGYTFSSAPTVHYIAPAGPVPNGCSGTVAAPVADPGHLCVFAFANNGVGDIDIRNVSNLAGVASPFGANLFASADASGNVYAYGSWAVRGLGLAAGAPRETPTQGGSTVPGQ